MTAYSYRSKVFPTTTGTFKAFNKEGRLETYSTAEAANIFSRSGSDPVHYEGFDITPAGLIYKNGVRVFVAPWQLCDGVDEAKELIDRSLNEKAVRLKMISKTYEPKEPDNYDLFQMEQYGNVLKPIYITPDGECHNDEDELRRFEHYQNMQQ